jgi:dienelactone hydrolase
VSTNSRVCPLVNEAGIPSSAECAGSPQTLGWLVLFKTQSRDQGLGRSTIRESWPRWRLLGIGVLLFAVGCGAVINTLGGMGRWGWKPSPKVARHDTSFVSGGRRILVERFSPAATGLAHLGIRTRHHPAVLVLHSSAGMLGRGGANVRGWADAFAERGFVAYVVHYFDRTGDVRTDDAREDSVFPQWTATLRDAVTFARADAEVDPLRVDAFGISLGGYMALALGAHDQRVSRLVILSGGFFEALAPEVRRLPPTLLLHGDADDVVPVERARRVDSTLTRLRVPHALVVYPGGSHGLDDELEPDAIKRSLLFLDAPHATDGVARALAGRVARRSP